MEGSERWVQCRTPDAGVRVQLFCFPHAGGGTSSFHAWRAALGPTIQVCPILLPGRELRLSESLFTDFDRLLAAITEAVRPQPSIPFAIFGHSMGALLAFEWARRLQQEKGPAPAHLFLSGRRAPDCPIDAPLLTPLPDNEFLDELARTYQGLPSELLQERELMEVMLPVLRADLAVVESYVFREGEPIQCPVTVFAGVDDGTVSYDQLLAWQRQTCGEFVAHLLPGGHFHPEKPLLDTIASTLNAATSVKASS